MRRTLFASLLLVFGLSQAPELRAALGYDIVYVRAPRYGDTTPTTWPEIFHPTSMEPGTDLMLLHSDGTEEVLVPSGPSGAVIDPCVSFDGQSVYYSYFPNVADKLIATNGQVGAYGVPKIGSDVYRIHVPTRKITRLTFQESTPNTGVGAAAPLYGVFNTGPCPVAGGKIVFTSTRNRLLPVGGFTQLVFQLFVMDEDGANVHSIAPMTLGSALHPMQLVDGRIIWSSYESQGIRDIRLWGLWSIWPDGRAWAPFMSAFNFQSAMHFSSQTSDQQVQVVDYYNLNNEGFGTLYSIPALSPMEPVRFSSEEKADNPLLQKTGSDGQLMNYWLPFTPKGLAVLTPWSTPDDQAAGLGADGVRLGKVTQPSGAPNNDLLLVWTPGPANNLARPVQYPRYDGGIYLDVNAARTATPQELVLIKNDPNYNEQQPRALVPYAAIYGVDHPHQFSWLPNAGSPHLPEGTPFGIVGTSSLYKRESFPGVATGSTWDGLDAMQPAAFSSSNWKSQGADAGKYTNADIWGVRILLEEPTSLGGRKWFNHVDERLRIWAEIPVRKGTFDAEGNPDTSFWAKLPADTPFTFQMIDAEGRTLAMAQTWHQVRPGEQRTDCGGCHAHSQTPLAFEGTAASSTLPVLMPSHAQDVEFLRDIRPILRASCVKCHTGGDAAPARLDLSDTEMYANKAPVPALPGDYMRLAKDQNSRWGIQSWMGNGLWKSPQASRYIRMLQSRRSVLAWMVAGKRLDGWTNESWPSEAVPGDPTTLPSGAKDIADVDYKDTIGHGTLLTQSQKERIYRWIDIGAPIDLGGYFKDEQRPVLTVSQPRPNTNDQPITAIRVGAADVGSGLDLASLTVEGVKTLGRTEESPGVYVFALETPITSVTPTSIAVSVRDLAGNVTRQAVRFWVEAQGTPPPLTITCPAETTVASPDGQPVVVTYPLATTTGGVPPVSMSGAPASGSAFPVGTSTVVQTARSSDGRTASCSQILTVTAPPPVPTQPVGTEKHLGRSGRECAPAATARTPACRPTSGSRPPRSSSGGRTTHPR